MSSNSLTIIIDHREPQKIKDRMRKMEVEVTEKQLDVGDYIISNEVVVERKTGLDLVTSIADNRLFQQINNMLENFSQPLLILEDFPSAFNNPNWQKRKKHVFGALTYIFLKRNIPIIPTSGLTETSICLERICSWTQQEHDDPILVRKSPKRLSTEERQLFFLQGLEDTGIKKSKILLETFNSPTEVFGAIKESEILYTKTGNPKGVKGPFENLKGFGHNYIAKNQKLLNKQKK